MTVRQRSVIDIRLLGKVELYVEGRQLDVGTPRQQAVWATLVVDVGRLSPSRHSS
ncbi:hypothetical protein [Micromonospora rubida]